MARNPENIHQKMVPPDTKKFLMPAEDTTDSFSLNYEKFLQYDENDQKIFLINSEILLLHFYLYGNYFKSDAAFPPQYWNYHDNIMNIMIVNLHFVFTIL